MIVAQISDIHASGTESLDRLEQAIAWLTHLRPDALIVSGDLAEPSDEGAYRQVLRRLERLGCPVHVVPGNVDDRDTMRVVFGEDGRWPAQGPLNCVAPVGQALRVIGLDVTVPGAHFGDAGPVLAWLEEQLNSGGAPAIVFMHQHPFFCGIEGKDRNNCRNAEALSLVVGRSRDGVLATTCGHVHRAMFTRFAALPATMCPSIARANRLRLGGAEPAIADPPGLLVHHVSEGRLVTHVVAWPWPDTLATRVRRPPSSYSAARAGSSPPACSMKAMISSSPWRRSRSVNTWGRPARATLVSLSITSRLAPT